MPRRTRGFLFQITFTVTEYIFPASLQGFFPPEFLNSGKTPHNSPFMVQKTCKLHIYTALLCPLSMNLCVMRFCHLQPDQGLFVHAQQLRPCHCPVNNGSDKKSLSYSQSKISTSKSQRDVRKSETVRFEALNSRRRGCPLASARGHCFLSLNFRRGGDVRERGGGRHDHLHAGHRCHVRRRHLPRAAARLRLHHRVRCGAPSGRHTRGTLAAHSQTTPPNKTILVLLL